MIDASTIAATAHRCSAEKDNYTNDSFLQHMGAVKDFFNCRRTEKDYDLRTREFDFLPQYFNYPTSQTTIHSFDRIIDSTSVTLCESCISSTRVLDIAERIEVIPTYALAMKKNTTSSATSMEPRQDQVSQGKESPERVSFGKRKRDDGLADLYILLKDQSEEMPADEEHLTLDLNLPEESLNTSRYDIGDNVTHALFTHEAMTAHPNHAEHHTIKGEASLFHLIDALLKDDTGVNHSISQFLSTNCNLAQDTRLESTKGQPSEDMTSLKPSQSYSLLLEGLACNSKVEHHDEILNLSELLCDNSDLDESGFFGTWQNITEASNDDPLINKLYTAHMNLKTYMQLSSKSMSKLQEWDRSHGLPKSHCQTMVSSSRSREQLKSGMVPQKWNGKPLLHLPGAPVKVRRKIFAGRPVGGRTIPI